MRLTTRVHAFICWLKRLLSWFMEPSTFWLMIAVIASAAFFLFRGGVTESEIRITGLVLQLLGIGTVAWGIRKTRVLFGHPGIVDVSLKWLRRFPKFGNQVVTATMGINSSIGGHARAYASATAGPTPTIEARIEAVEKNIHHLHSRIDETQHEMDKNFRAHNVIIEAEREARKEGLQEVHNKLEITETGGLHISAVGALWLSIGVILSTASIEIFAYLNKYS